MNLLLAIPRGFVGAGTPVVRALSASPTAPRAVRGTYSGAGLDKRDDRGERTARDRDLGSVGESSRAVAGPVAKRLGLVILRQAKHPESKPYKNFNPLTSQGRGSTLA